MTPPVPIEVPAGRKAVVRQLLAPHDEPDARPDGTVLDARERQILAGGRDLQLRLLIRAVARRGRRRRRCGHGVYPRGRVRNLKSAVISKRVAGATATPDEWHERSRTAAGVVPASP